MLDKEEALVYCMILAASSDAEIHPYEKDRIYNIVGGYPIFKNMDELCYKAFNIFYSIHNSTKNNLYIICWQA